MKRNIALGDSRLAGGREFGACVVLSATVQLSLKRR